MVSKKVKNLKRLSSSFNSREEDRTLNHFEFEHELLQAATLGDLNIILFYQCSLNKMLNRGIPPENAKRYVYENIAYSLERLHNSILYEKITSALSGNNGSLDIFLRNSAYGGKNMVYLRKDKFFAKH